MNCCDMYKYGYVRDKWIYFCFDFCDLVWYIWTHCPVINERIRSQGRSQARERVP